MGKAQTVRAVIVRRMKATGERTTLMELDERMYDYGGICYAEIPLLHGRQLFFGFKDGTVLRYTWWDFPLPDKAMIKKFNRLVGAAVKAYAH